MSNTPRPAADTPLRLTSMPVDGLQGELQPPGDKSISHRAVLFSALATGESVVRGLLDAEDVRATIGAARQLGAQIDHNADFLHVTGVGLDNIQEPAVVLDMGNSGTAARLIAGLVAGRPMTTVLTGDASLRSRPMGRVIEPLTRMGARFQARKGGRLPLSIAGAEAPVPLAYASPIASAQVKSAVLLAGLSAAGETSVVEPLASRDHTERMLPVFGVPVATARNSDGHRAAVVGPAALSGANIAVPADPSSAAFAVVGALIAPGSDILLRNVLVNPHRAGLFATLMEMGAELSMENMREEGGEPVADMHVRASHLKGLEVPAERAPSMIDEYPVLAVAAAFARGTTRMRGLSELRVKESDRLEATLQLLKANGVDAGIEGDDLIVAGADGRPGGGGEIEAHGDHRIAMSALVLGLAAAEPVAVRDARAIATSYPGFMNDMNALGGAIQEGGV